MESAASTSPVACLDEDWEIVLVVLDRDSGGLDETLEDLETYSLGRQISVLAEDSPKIREALSAQTLPVKYGSLDSSERGSFWTSLLARHRFASVRTLFVFAGARLPVAWDARLVAVAQANPKAAVVVPLLSRHPQLSAFSQPQEAPTLPVNAVDQWLNDYARGQVFSAPIMPQACLLLQGDYWGEEKPAGYLDVQLRMDLASRGEWLVATDQLYVDDSACNYAIDPESLPPAFVRGYENHHPLASLRHALWELCARCELPPLEKPCLPVQLHVGHSWGGGLNRWIENYLASDKTCHHLVLRSIGDKTAFGQQIALYGSADMEVPLRSWVLAQPIHSTVVSQLEYSALLADVVALFNIESLVISSFIGHSLDLLHTGLPTTLVLHDFFPFCPALYACFESPCQQCDAATLNRCGQVNPLHSFFKQEPDEHWRVIRQAYARGLRETRPTVVAPTRSVIDRYARLEPAVGELEVEVIPHGLNDELVANFTASASRRAATERSSQRATGAQLRVLVLGRMTAEKGAALLEALVPLTTDFAEFFLVGAGEGGESFKDVPGCTVIDDYSLGELPGDIAGIGPDLGLLLSVVPETFSYTLSELWALGIPVLATNLGAFSDRIVDGKNGWLEEPDPAQLAARLRALASDTAALKAAGDSVHNQRVPTASDMVEAYSQVHPRHAGIPLRRFNLPRRSFQNPYLGAEQGEQTRLYLQRTRGVEATYRGVLKEFLQYSGQKAQQSPRIPRFLRSLLGKAISLMLKLL